MEGREKKEKGWEKGQEERDPSHQTTPIAGNAPQACENPDWDTGSA